ncbi:MAG: PH domain-containing protein [Propionibacteriaceae bacterium]|nr:PH domain-containing protein [Propionibacteriaceae bacterium]
MTEFVPPSSDASPPPPGSSTTGFPGVPAQPAGPNEAVAAEVAQGPALKATERPHPLTPLIRGWVLLVAGVVAVGQDLLPGRRSPDAPSVPWWWFLVAIGGVAFLAGLASILTWWFTRFVIDDEEFRVESGFVNRSSKRIGFSRIQSVDVVQPLAARIFGLCELRIEAGAGDSGVVLRYLTRDKAYRFRDYLLSRAHGHTTTVAESGARPQASVFEDLSSADRVLVRISPQQLLIGLLTSFEFFISVILLVVAGVIAWRLGAGIAAMAAVLPFAMGVVGLVSRRVLTQFNYTLAETGGAQRPAPGAIVGSAAESPASVEPTGLRITRGLTNLTSQSVPLDRIQGVRIRQSWLWRRLKLHRVDIEVLGYASSGDDNQKQSSSMLFPVATTEQVRIAMAYLLPGVQDEFIPLHPVDPKAKWLRPLSFRTLRWGADERVIVSEGGLLVFVRDTVPHAKTQSVRVSQGPLQRRLGLATVHVDTTPGPVDFVIPHLPVAEARNILDNQLPAAAHARQLAADARLEQQWFVRPSHPPAQTMDRLES